MLRDCVVADDIYNDDKQIDIDRISHIFSTNWHKSVSRANDLKLYHISKYLLNFNMFPYYVFAVGDHWEREKKRNWPSFKQSN